MCCRGNDYSISRSKLLNCSVSFANEPYFCRAFLQKTHENWERLLTVTTPHVEAVLGSLLVCCNVLKCAAICGCSAVQMLHSAAPPTAALCCTTAYYMVVEKDGISLYESL